MGSGGGRSSSGITTRRPRQGGGGGGGGGGPLGDDCNIAFEADLASVNGAAAQALNIGDLLDVALIKQGAFDVAICRKRDDQAPVGSLANVEDLAQLIACLSGGRRYSAEVRDAGPTFCTVFVQPE